MADEKERMEQQAPGQEEPVLSPEEENPPPQETQAEEPDPRDAELERLREENRELEERHLRLMAEFANFRNRTAKERESLYSDAVANTLKELLPVLDNFQPTVKLACFKQSLLGWILSNLFNLLQSFFRLVQIVLQNSLCFLSHCIV